MINKVIPYILIYLIVTFSVGGAEVLARHAPHDDGYFFWKSVNFFHENYMYGLKEVGYPLFIKMSNILSLNISTFQCFVYAIFCILLFEELCVYLASRFIAFLLVVIVAANPLSNVVTQYLTSDVLQYLLIPLTIYSLLRYIRESNAQSHFIASGVIVAHFLARPDWVVFLIPYIIATLGLLYFNIETYRGVFKATLRIVVVFLTCYFTISSFNYLKYGFFSPTLVSSASVNNVIKDLMVISGEGDDRYSPISKEAYYKAFEISSEFGLLKRYYESNFDGNGWSRSWAKEYSTKDGSIDGGHHNFALIDGVASINAGNAKQIIRSLDLMHEEFMRSESFQLQNQASKMFATKLGPNFSFDKKLFDSVLRIFKILINPKNQIYTLTERQAGPMDVYYDRYLRRAAWSNLGSGLYTFSGWIINSKYGGAQKVIITEGVDCNGVKIEVNSRSDLNKFITNPTDGVINTRGFTVNYSNRNHGCDIVFSFGKDDIKVRLKDLSMMGVDMKFDSYWLHKDELISLENKAFLNLRLVLEKSYPYIYNVLYVGLLIAILLVSSRRLFLARRDLIVICSTSSIVLSKLFILAAIDSSMFPGDEVRYYAPGVLVLLFSISFFLRKLHSSKGI